jgi:hypothetical protein
VQAALRFAAMQIAILSSGFIPVHAQKPCRAKHIISG